MGPFVLFFLVFVGIAGVSAYSFSKKRDQWRAFAHERGLSLGGSFFRPVLEGHYAGHAVHVLLERRGRRNDSHYTVYRVQVGVPMPPGFAVSKEGLLHRLGKVVGVHDITVGNPELDEALSIKGNDRVAILRLMNVPEVGAAVLGMVTAFPTVAIGQGIHVEEHGIAEAYQLEAMLDALVDLARALEAGVERLAEEDGGASPWARG